MDFDQACELVYVFLSDFVADLQATATNYALALGVSVEMGPEIFMTSLPVTTEVASPVMMEAFELRAKGLAESRINRNYGSSPALAFKLAAQFPETPEGVEGRGTNLYFIRVPDLPNGMNCSVFAWTQRSASAGMQPLFLVRFARYLRYALRQEEGEVLDNYLYDAAEVQDGPDLLHGIARRCGAEGAILWKFDFAGGRYSQYSSWGPVGLGYSIPLGGVRRGNATEGIVGQARPEQPLVVYQTNRPDLWSPGDIPHWEPHDPDVFSRNEWHGCVAWPVISAGELLGAISIYGRDVEALNFDEGLRGWASTLVREILRQDQLMGSLAVIEDTYELEAAKDSAGALALELIHDFKQSLDGFSTFYSTSAPVLERRGEASKQVLLEAGEQLMLMRQVTRALSLASKGRTSAGRCDPSKVLEEHAAFITRIARRQNSSVTVELNAETLKTQVNVWSTYRHEIEMDQSTYLRVVINLVLNAAWWTQDTEAPHIGITLGVRYGDSELSTMLKVVDNGRGIPAEDLGQVFNLGFSRRKHEGGSGLGLHIVKRAAEAAGGHVQVWSRPGRFTIFQVSVPNVRK